MSAPDKKPDGGQGRPRHLPRLARRQGLAAVAWSPRTGLLYIPHQNLCQDEETGSGELHRRHALPRRQRQDVRRARAATAAW